MEVRLPRNAGAPTEPKNMWLASLADARLMVEPAPRAPIFFKAPAMAPGLRVNCTEAASARYSRWRLTAALIRLPKKVPA